MSGSEMRHLLLVAFQFPPLQGSSGVHRILSFAKYLRELGWRVTVLTAHPRAYARTIPANEALIPHGIQIIRCSAFDARRHLSVFGKYPAFFARPDRWKSWIWPGIAAGLKLIASNRPDLILSSYPIASASFIASRLSSFSGIPWVADLRDPIVTADHPPPGAHREQHEKLERRVFDQAARVIVTTKGAAKLYRRRYADRPPDFISVVENGFDDELFQNCDIRREHIASSHRLKILHSGLVYEQARNPVVLFDSLSKLIENKVVSSTEIEIVFRASNRETFIRDQAKKFGLEKVVVCADALGYADAISEMRASDSLLILQSAACNDQIPAKVYEYLRCRRPILAIADPDGDTGTLLKSFGVIHIAPLEDEEKVLEIVEDHIKCLQANTIELPSMDDVRTLSRWERAKDLAKVLENIIEIVPT